MRTLRLAILAAVALGAACGQKGPLVLPDHSVATPVVIRTNAAVPAAPATTAPAPTASSSAEQPPPADHRDDEPEPPPPKR